MIKTFCDGCGHELGPAPSIRAVTLTITRVNGLGGGRMPEPGDPWHLCGECGTAMGTWLDTRGHGHPGAGEDGSPT